MKQLLVLLSFSSVMSFAKAQNDIIVDPNAEVRTLNGSFHAIKVSGGIELYLTQSGDEAMAVSASEDKYRNGIKTTVENGVLKIHYEGDRLLNMRNKKLKVYVSCKSIDHLEALGASDVRVTGTISGSSLALDLSGASDFRGVLKVGDLQLNLSGASDVTVSGSASSINIESTGASDVKGYGLSAETCNAKVSGASDISITVNKTLSANASGSSRIYYKGNAEIKEVHSSGSSDISRKS